MNRHVRCLQSVDTVLPGHSQGVPAQAPERIHPHPPGLARSQPNQLGPVLFEHGGATGVALAWELQLLATPTTDSAGA